MTAVTVTRAFCLAGLRQEVGAVVDVSPGLAAELVAYGKASFDVLPDAAPAPKRKAKKETPNEPV